MKHRIKIKSPEGTLFVARGTTKEYRWEKNRDHEDVIIFPEQDWLGTIAELDRSTKVQLYKRGLYFPDIVKEFEIDQEEEEGDGLGAICQGGWYC